VSDLGLCNSSSSMGKLKSTTEAAAAQGRMQAGVNSYHPCCGM
jgi:hypothetical protein